MFIFCNRVSRDERAGVTLEEVSRDWDYARGADRAMGRGWTGNHVRFEEITDPDWDGFDV